MILYTKDAIKEVEPKTTLEKCDHLFRKFNFDRLTLSHDIFEKKQEMFGIFTGHFEVNPFGFYEMFPEKFPYLKDRENLNFQVSNGKGLSRKQCEASMHVEMFERLSIKLYEQKVKTQGEDVRKVFKASEYYDYVRKNAPYLENHVKSDKFVLELPESGTHFIRVKDIVDNSEVFFPEGILFDTMGTNGFTAGNTDEEAITGGIFEIVERYTQTLFCLDAIDAKKISLGSIKQAFPELSDAIDKSSGFLDKYDIIDVSITINGVKFYSYFARTEYFATGHKTFSSGGCHLDQRIALIRAITEGIQSFEPDIENAGGTITRKQAWGPFRMFSNYFINTIYSRMDQLEEIPIVVNKIDFDSIHQIYEKSLEAFDHILIVNCTNDNFSIPAFIIYIPDLFPKTYIWPVLFHIGTGAFKNKIIPENIEGLEMLFFWDYELLNSREESERKNYYFKTVSKLCNFDINKQLELLDANYIQQEKQKQIKAVTCIDKDDPDSFVYFDHKYSEKSDFNYLFESLSRMGFISLANEYIDKVEQELVDRYLLKYLEFGEYLYQEEEYERALILYKQLYLFNNDNVAERIQEIEEMIKSSNSRKKSVYNAEENSIVDLSPGDEFEDFVLKSIVDEGLFSFELCFEFEGEEFIFTLHAIAPDDFQFKTKNGFFIDHLYSLLTKKEKRFIKKFIKRINTY